MNTNIEFFKKQFLEARDSYVSEILNSIVDEETFWEYYPKLNNVLPVEEWLMSCPKFICEWTHHYNYYRGEVIYFDDIIEHIDSYRDDKECLTRQQIEIIENNTSWDLMKIVLEFTKENKICGFTWNW